MGATPDNVCAVAYTRSEEAAHREANIGGHEPAPHPRDDAGATGEPGERDCKSDREARALTGDRRGWHEG